MSILPDKATSDEELSIELEDVVLDLPIFGRNAKNLRSVLLNPFFRKTDHAVGDSPIVRALDGINMSLKHGDRVGLVGHNGAGKSSLLRLLAGIYWPTSGIYRKRGTTRCLFGLGRGVEPEASGFENIEILSQLFGYPRSAIKDITEDVAEFCELGDALARPVRTYSEGMRLRLCFGVVTAWPSDILLIDEVIGVSDRSFKEKANQRMKDFTRQSGILVLASHDEQILSGFCHECLRLDHGKIISRTPIEDEVDQEGEVAQEGDAE